MKGGKVRLKGNWLNFLFSGLWFTYRREFFESFFYLQIQCSVGY